MLTLKKQYPSAIKYYFSKMVCKKGNWSRERCKLGYYELIYIVDGKMVAIENDKEYLLEKGDLFVISPNMVNYLRSETKGGVLYYCVDFFILVPDLIRFDEKQIKTGGNIRLNEQFKHLINVSTCFDYPEGVCEQYLSLIFAEIVVCQYKDINQTAHTVLVNQIKEWVGMNIFEHQNTAAKVSDAFGYSKNYICKIFKRTYGQKIQEYVNQQCLGIAKHLLLNTNLSVKSIAEKLGYNNSDCFIKFFKYHESCSPSEFRVNYCSGLMK